MSTAASATQQETADSAPFVQLDESDQQNNGHAESKAQINGSSAPKALLNFLKGMFGAGILAIPHAFQLTGIPAGIILYLFVGLTCTAAMLALIYIKHELQRRHQEYEELEKEAQLEASNQENESERARAKSISGVPFGGSEEGRRRLRREHPHLDDDVFSPRQAMRSISAHSSNRSDENGKVSTDNRPSIASLNSNMESQNLLEKLETTSSATLNSSDFVVDDTQTENQNGDVAVERDEEHKIQTYAEVGEAALGVWGRYLVEVNVVILEWAFCAGFVNVGYSNVRTLMKHHPPSRAIAGLIVTPLLILLSWIKKVKDLWFISFLGLAVYVVGVIGVTFVEGGIRFQKNEHDVTHAELWQGCNNASSIGDTILDYTAFIGNSVYSLEGINLVLPVETSLANKKMAPLVIGGGTIFYCCIVCLLGSFGFAAGFGGDNGGCDTGGEGVVTDNLSGIAGTVVRITLVVALLFTHALTLFPATEIVERRLFDPDDDSFKTTWITRGIRALQVILTVIIGLAARSFSQFSALIGALFMSTVGFLMPALFTWVAFNGNEVWPFSLWFSSDNFQEEQNKQNDPFSFLEQEDLGSLTSDEGPARSSDYELPSTDDFRTTTPEQRMEQQLRIHHPPSPGERKRFLSFDPALVEPRLMERSKSMSGGVINPGKLRPLSPGPCMGPWGVAACLFGVGFGFFVMIFGLYQSIKSFM